ncbi:MAG: hypothetical protein ABFD54_11410 [Armatimonadota bacterium]
MAKTYVVNNTCLILGGRNMMNGTVLSEQDLQDVDVKRLIRLGAIIEIPDSDVVEVDFVGEEAAELQESPLGIALGGFEPPRGDEIPLEPDLEDTEDVDEAEEAEVDSVDEVETEEVEEIEEPKEVEEVEAIEEPAYSEAADTKLPPLTRMNRAQLLGVMADMGISPENEDKMNRVEMIEAIKQAQTDAAD